MVEVSFKLDVGEGVGVVNGKGWRRMVLRFLVNRDFFDYLSWIGGM